MSLRKAASAVHAAESAGGSCVTWSGHDAHVLHASALHGEF